MAILIDITNSNFGVPFNGAYFRIVTAAVMRQRDDVVRHSVMIDVVGYATKPENDDTKEVDFRRYHAPLEDIEVHDGSDFLTKLYKWVTMQPDMVNSKNI